MVKKPSSNSSKGKQTQTQTHSNNPIPIRETRSKTSTSIKGKSLMKPCRTSKAKPEKAVEYVVIEDDGIEVDDMLMDDDVYEEELDDDDDEEEYYGFDADDDSDKGTDQNELSYSVLSEDDIRNRQEEHITAVTSVLSLSRGYACILLTSYNWSVGAVHEAWFADEEKVRKDVGLLEETVVWDRNSRGLTCGVCFDKYRGKEMCDAGCGHLFCNLCWTGYLSTSINDGPGCLTLRCPDPSCDAAIGKDLVDSLVSDEDKEKYSRFLIRSYVETNRKTKWCPGPGCEYAVDYVAGSGNYDVSCYCTCTFCWNCLEDAHRPVDCDTVSKWVLKNTAEAENTNWILANSKPCPKCKRAIEKNNGCMHMTCTPPCRFQFCWLCLGDWKEHGKGTGGFYACNRYEAAKKEGAFDESEKIREMAKKSLERYTHYYERWAANQKSRDKALEDLHKAQSVYIDRLSSNQCQLKSQIKFITEAWQQIIECRRVLKWTYAYGYYLPEHEQAKREFFEYLQGEAEYALERLHKCAEKDIEVFLQGDEQINEFGEFRIKLTNLTNSTRIFFENLVQALENGLVDVASGSICPSTVSSKHLEEGKKGKGEKGKGSTSRSTPSSRRHGVNPPSIVSASQSQGVNPQIPVVLSRGQGVNPPDPVTPNRRQGVNPPDPVAPSRTQGVNPPNPVAPSRSQVVAPPIPVFAPNHVPASSIQGENPSNSAAAATNLSQEDSGPWSCEHCTYFNGTGSITCQVCSRPQISWSCGACTFLNGEFAAECHMCGEPR